MAVNKMPKNYKAQKIEYCVLHLQQQRHTRHLPQNVLMYAGIKVFYSFRYFSTSVKFCAQKSGGFCSNSFVFGSVPTKIAVAFS